MIVTLAKPVNPRATLQQQADNELLDDYVRLAALALARTDGGGHAKFTPGQLTRLLNLEGKATSNAIKRAKAKGLLDPCSNAWCLVLPGHALSPCEVKHR